MSCVGQKISVLQDGRKRIEQNWNQAQSSHYGREHWDWKAFVLVSFMFYGKKCTLHK